VNFGELFETLGYAGFRRLAGKFWRTGMGEMWRSASKGAFVKALQRLVPAIESKHIHAAPAGVRAQAIGPDGKTIDDFAFTETDRAVHVLNAPSPAATASLAIAEMIVDKLETKLSGSLGTPQKV
jgi:L-2-hydroxyglutarate oxidase